MRNQETRENLIQSKVCGLMLDIERTETKISLKGRQGQKNSNPILSEKLTVSCAQQKDPVPPTQREPNLKHMFWKTGHYLLCSKTPCHQITDGLHNTYLGSDRVRTFAYMILRVMKLLPSRHPSFNLTRIFRCASKLY